MLGFGGRDRRRHYHLIAGDLCNGGYLIRRDIEKLTAVGALRRQKHMQHVFQGFGSVRGNLHFHEATRTVAPPPGREGCLLAPGKVKFHA